MREIKPIFLYSRIRSMKEDSAYKPMAITNISIFLLCGLMSLQKKPFWRVRTRFLGVSGELIPTTNFTLCKSTACRLNSQWLRTDQKSRSHLSMNSTSDRFLIGSPCQIHSLQRSLPTITQRSVSVQASTVRLPSTGRQIRDRS